jgi:hypothetical protein
MVGTNLRIRNESIVTRDPIERDAHGSTAPAAAPHR